MGDKVAVAGPWYALIRDVVGGSFKVSAWRALSSFESEDEARRAVHDYVEAAEHEVQWEIGEVLEPRPGGVVVLALRNGAVSNVKICETCATIMGMGKAWQQIVGLGKCGGCDAQIF